MLLNLKAFRVKKGGRLIMLLHKKIEDSLEVVYEIR